MKKNLLIAAVLIFGVVLCALVWYLNYKPTVVSSVEPVVESDIHVNSFKAGDSVNSPLEITGQARGTWFFEGSFPIEIVDKTGKVVAQGHAQATSDWMTANFVPFKATITFGVKATQAGEIVLKKDNPSDLPEHDKQIRIPVTLIAQANVERTVKLFFYNAKNDQDQSGNILCSKQGLVPVERQIPFTKTPIQDAVRLLLRGELTPAERSQGITTEFPLPGLELNGADLKNSVLTLDLIDPNNKTSGGACRAGILWAQIAATAKQFPEVKEVKFKSENLFQP